MPAAEAVRLRLAALADARLAPVADSDGQVGLAPATAACLFRLDPKPNPTWQAEGGRRVPRAAASRSVREHVFP